MHLVPHYLVIKYESPIQTVWKHFTSYHSPGLNEIPSSWKHVHVKFSYWPLLPTKQPSALLSTPSAVQLPRCGGFALFSALIWLRHPLPLSKQSIQSISLICKPLDRSKGLFCSASPRELPSLLPFLLPSAERSPCSFPGCRELSPRDGAVRARGRGFSWRGAAARSTLTDLPVRAQWLQRHAGRQASHTWV